MVTYHGQRSSPSLTMCRKLPLSRFPQYTATGKLFKITPVPASGSSQNI